MALTDREKRSRRKRLVVILVVALVLFGAVPLWFRHAHDVANQRAIAASAEIGSELETTSLDRLWHAEVDAETSGDAQQVFQALPHPTQATQTGPVAIDKTDAKFSYEVSYAGATACVNVEMTPDATLVAPGPCPK